MSLKISFQETDTASDNFTQDPQYEPMRSCIFCNQSEGDKLRDFDANTWAAAKTAAEHRLLQTADKYREASTEINLKTCPGRFMYHSKPCYKNFTAVIRPPPRQSKEEPPKKKPETQQRSFIPQDDVKGLLKGSCIFCGKARKTTGGKPETLSDCLTLESSHRIMTAAPHSSSDRIKGLVGMDLVAKGAQYHKSCYRAYFKEIEKLEKQKSTQVQK